MSVTTLSDAERCVSITREVLLRHLDGAPPQRSFDLLPDDDGLFRSFPSTPESRAAQQFLLALRQHADLLYAAAAAAGAESDASIASTVIRVAPPLAAASSSPPPPAPTAATLAASSFSAQPDGDNDEESLLAWRSDSDTGDYPDGDEHAPDAGIVNSSGAENSDYSGDDGDDQAPDASIVNSSDSDSDTRVPNRDDVERYFAKLQRKLARAVKIEDQRSSNRARKLAHDWFRKKLSRTDHPQHRIEREIDRVRRRATRLRAALFPRRRR